MSTEWNVARGRGSYARQRFEPNRTPNVSQITTAASNGLRWLSLESQPSQAPKRLSLVQGVHKDDVHGLIKMGDFLISGSKDGTFKRWDLNGNLLGEPLKADRVDYTKWATALSALDDTHWLGGTRDGSIGVWSVQTDEQVGKVAAAPERFTDDHTKVRNFTRVNCLASIPSVASRKFAIGWPTSFSLHEVSFSNQENLPAAVEESKQDLLPSVFQECLYANVAMHDRDWVYAIHPLSEQKLAVATAGRLDLVCQSADKKYTTTPLRREDRAVPGQGPQGRTQRSFISAITPMQGQISQLGLSIFNGKVAIFDVETQRDVWFSQEHSKRVWKVENIAPHRFASCADDGLIKLWDSRVSSSVYSWRDNETQSARVSALLSLDENQLMSASCPDRFVRGTSPASFSFWDLRSQ